MDKTANYFCLLPRYTILMPSEDINTTCGKNKSKDHVSLVVCDNATGTHKIPCTLIGNQKHQHAFKVENGPCHIIFREKHGWMLKLAGNGSMKYFILK
jgi:DDE superfamily endonuclease